MWYLCNKGTITLLFQFDVFFFCGRNRVKQILLKEKLYLKAKQILPDEIISNKGTKSKESRHIDRLVSKHINIHRVALIHGLRGDPAQVLCLGLQKV